MSDSITKPSCARDVHSTLTMGAAVMALSIALTSCASGSGTPAAFSIQSAPEDYDASAAGGAAVEGVSAQEAGDDASYESADALSCAVSSPDNGADAAADDAGSAATPSTGDLIITEIMFDPSGLVPEAQWFEIYNLTNGPVLLSGLTIQDAWGDAQTISANAPVIAPPSTYVVLVRDLTTAVANGIPDASIVYEYGAGLSPDQGIELASDWTGDLSLWNGGVEIVDVPYGPWGVASTGQSIELASLQFVGADQSANWCLAQDPWAPGSDDGTPGEPSDCF